MGELLYGSSASRDRRNDLNTLLKRLVADDPRAEGEVVQAMATAAGVEVGTVREILSGDIRCPPRPRLSAFARVLDVSPGRLIDASTRDGCLDS